ncbi:MAG: MFS transporter [Deltaproteobacteria bacterium]|nr:MFS transporter [Deltaproteobacteria bacterium]
MNLLLNKIKNLYYGWVMVFLAVIGLTVLGIQVYSFGIFIKPVTQELQVTRGALAMAMSLPGFFGGLFQIFAGRLADQYGPRYLVAASGVSIFIGCTLMWRAQALWEIYLINLLPMLVGNACGYLPMVSNISRWFGPRYRGTAIGIVVAGFTLGGTIGPMMIQSFISSFGWRRAYFFMGLIFIVVLGIISQFMKHTPQKMGLQPWGEEPVPVMASPPPIAGPLPILIGDPGAVEGLSLLEALKTSQFWIFSLIGIIFIFTWMSMVQHLAPHATDIGIPAMTAAGIVSLIAVGGIFGKLVFGVIVSWTGARKAICGCLVLFTLPQLMLFFSNGIGLLYCFALIFGFAYGGMVTLTNVGTAEFFGVKSIGTILAVYFYVTSLGGLSGPPVFGYIFDRTGGYHLAFLISIILCALAFMLSLILLRSEDREPLMG